MESKIRFGVTSEDGRTSNVWTCWTNPQKGDAYLTSEVLGQVLKLSDHPTGRSHIAFHYEKRDELFTLEALPKERFILKQEGAERAEAPWWMVACLNFPAGSLHEGLRETPADTIWLPEAPEGQATEIGIFRFNAQTMSGAWTGQHEGSGFVADLPLPNACRLSIVWRHASFQMPPSPRYTGNRGLFKGRSEDDLLQANRAVIFGTTDTGAFSLVETRVSVTRN